MFLKIGKVKAEQLPNQNTNIQPGSTDHWAWNDIIGWINFYNTNSVIVQSREIKGYASSPVGDISLNCDSSGNSSGMYNCPTGGMMEGYKVKNDGGGNLSGWAWNDLVGWISFCGTNNFASSSASCFYTGDSGPRYGPKLQWNLPGCLSSEDQPPSDFYNYAWSDVAGWISFNAIDPGFPTCPLPSGDANYEAGYKVRSNWYATSTYGDVYSSVFDTGITRGAQFNSVSFGADVPLGTAILLQFATECFPWMGTPPYCLDGENWKFVGPDGTTSTFYRVDPGYPDNSHSYGSRYVGLKNQYHNNSRYFRYRIRLKSNKPQTASPVVYDVTVNWSP